MSIYGEISINTYYTPSTKDQDVFFYCVAGDYQVIVVLDGHGHFGKEFAILVKQKFIAKLQVADFTLPIKSLITNIFETTNTELDEPKFKASGCTATMILLSKTKMIVANVGDSDAFIFDENLKLIKLTQDHCLTTKSEVERINSYSKSKGLENSITFATRNPYGYGKVPLWDKDMNLQPLDPRYHFNRNRMGEIAAYIEMINVGVPTMINMTRSIGDYKLKNIGISATPDISVYDRPIAGTNLLVGSDGFWDCWTIAELESELADEDKRKLIHSTSVRMTNFYFGKGNGDDNTLVMLSL
jgi:serine/threonine protein phosphatase PrpC